MFTVVALCGALIVSAGAVVVATGVMAPRVAEDLSSAARTGAVAQRMVRAAADGDVVTVFNVGELRSDVATAVAAASASAGGAWSPSRSASVGVVSVRRGGSFVQQAPQGFAYPLTVTAMPGNAIAAVLGADVATGLTPDTIVMGERAAGFRNAVAGDAVDLVAANGSMQAFTITQVVPDADVGGAEAVMTTAAADRIGVTRATRAVMWGFGSRSAVDGALAANGVPGGLGEVRVGRSWDPPNPDSTLSTGLTKERLGEYAYRVNANGSVTQEAAWAAANLPAGRELLNSQIPIRARCHHRVAADLRAALADVAAAGLASAIDVGNANTYGGCHNPRFNRISGELGFLSRHAWAMALDTNTVSNCQGCVPQMHCDVVRIFRRHGFAWGGNFLRPDGMHFEWVGERRDHISYPSRYCPNQVSGLAESSSVVDSRDRIFADETLATEHDH